MKTNEMLGKLISQIAPPTGCVRFIIFVRFQHECKDFLIQRLTFSFAHGLLLEYFFFWSRSHVRVSRRPPLLFTRYSTATYIGRFFILRAKQLLRLRLVECELLSIIMNYSRLLSIIIDDGLLTYLPRGFPAL